MPENKFNIDAQAVRQLAELLNETALTEVEYEIGGQRIRLARNIAPQAIAAPAAFAPFPAATPSMKASEEAKKETLSSPDIHPGAVKSPMVGTAYLASAPEAAPFVKVGDNVAKGDTLLIIEAMKVMNPIRAPQAGRVAEVLVKDASPVEYGTVLLILE